MIQIFEAKSFKNFLACGGRSGLSFALVMLKPMAQTSPRSDRPEALLSNSRRSLWANVYTRPRMMSGELVNSGNVVDTSTNVKMQNQQEI